MKRKTSALIILLSFTMMTGCTADFKVDENTVENISNKVTKTVIETLGKENAEKTESQTINATKMDNVVIRNSIGDINITTHDSMEVLVDVTIKASSNSKEGTEKLLRETTYTIEPKWNDIIIDTSQINRIYGDLENVSINLSIKVPSNINKIYVDNNVGNLNIENYNGKIESEINVGDINITNCNSSYYIKSDVGDIKLINCILYDKSEFNSNTGNIDITSTDISDAKSFEALTQVGDINITLPSNSSYESSSTAFMENEKTETKGSGNTKIKLTSKVGDVNFK